MSNSNSTPKLCSVAGCINPAAKGYAGYCHPHYNRKRKYGDPLAGGPFRVTKGKYKICTVPGCDKPNKAKGMCDTHRKQHLLASITKICRIPGCERTCMSLSSDLCNEHHRKIRDFGSIDNAPGTEDDAPLKWLKTLINAGPFPDSCIHWPYSLNRENYGVLFSMFLGKKRTLAHRSALTMFLGLSAFPPSEIVTRHLCGNRSCVNPRHLVFGTPLENGHDMVAHGRSQRGNKHYKSKLSENDVINIRADKRKTRFIATEYNISISHVRLIKRRRSWNWLE